MGRIELTGVDMAKSGLSGSSEAMRMLKEFEPGLYKELGKQLRTQLNPIIKPIQSEINSSVTQEVFNAMQSSNRPGKSGMFHNGRSSWTGANITARVGVKPSDLITVTATGRNRSFGFDYAELAGIQRRPPRATSKSYTRNGESRRHRVNGQGLAFNEKLGREFGKPGRFAWIRVLRRKPEIEAKVENIADTFGVKLSRRLA